MGVGVSGVGPWPDGRECAVSLTFDDGMATQLQVARPLLDQHDLAGSFYLIPRDDDDDWRARLEPWRAVAAAGHEIGNHSLSHACSETGGGPGGAAVGSGLEHMSLDEVEADLVEAERRLQEAIPEHAGERSFAYPCYQAHVGWGPTRQSYVAVVARHFPAARCRGVGPNGPGGVDLHYIWSWAVERCSGAELIGLCEWAALQQGWAVLTFHGINEGHLPVADADLRLLCTHLTKHRDRIWTAPAVTVAKRLLQWRNKTGAGPAGPREETRTR